jgi:hypothetical protein
MGEWKYSCTILYLGTSRSSVISFGPRQLYLRERASVTHWIRGWVGPRTHRNAVKKRKSFAAAGNRTIAVQPAAHRYTE